MATLEGRGRSLGVPDLGSERNGAVRPEGPSVDLHDGHRTTGPRGHLRPSRIRGIRQALTVHSEAFAGKKRGSLRSLLYADGVIVGPGAAMTASRVPSRRLGVALLVAGLASMTVPGLVVAEMSRGSWGAARAIVGVLLAFASIAGLIECLRRSLLAWRWRTRPMQLIEIADVCASPAGVGNAGRLLTQVCAEADETSTGFVLRVHRTNERAIALYRRAGFILEASADDQQLAVMTRCESAAPRPTRDANLPAGGVGAVLIGVATTTYWTANRDVLAALCLLCGLGALVRAATIDVRELRLPNVWTGLALACGVGGAIAVGAGFTVALGLAVGAAPFLLLHLLDPKALGFGDVKFAGAAGAVIAIVWWPASVFMALAALSTSLVCRIIRPRGPRAFGPYLMLGTLVALFAARFLDSKGLST